MDGTVGIGNTTFPGFRIEKHCTAWDNDTKMAVYIATFHGKLTGDGGPVAPTNKTMDTEYAYFVKVNDNDKVVKMQKVWNDGFMFKQLGWT